MCFLVPINVVMSHKQQGQIPIFFFPGGQSKIIKFRNSKFKGLKLLMTSTRGLVQKRLCLRLHLKYIL